MTIKRMTVDKKQYAGRIKLKQVVSSVHLSSQWTAYKQVKLSNFFFDKMVNLQDVQKLYPWHVQTITW